MIRQLSYPKKTNTKTRRAQFCTVPMRALTESEIARWAQIQSDNNALRSPYFHPEFSLAVSRVRDDVEVAMLSDEEGVLQSLFPFQRIATNQIEPVGGRLNDEHGTIAFDSQSQCAIAKLRESEPELNFRFHAGSTHVDSFEKFQFESIESFHLDLSNGWSHYFDWVNKHSSTVARHGQKERAFLRSNDNLRFEFDVQDSGVLEQLISLKRSKYQRSLTFDILSVDWAANLLREIHRTQSDNFRGILSAMFCGDRLVAAHFGMLSNEILHYWFPVYDPEFSKYSPGTSLLMKVAEHASRYGVRKLDLGYGTDPYKFKFCNGRSQLFCGNVAPSQIGFQVSKMRYHWRNRLKSIPMKKAVKSMLRATYPKFGSWNFK